MWNTPDGERKLTGAERRVALYGATSLLDQIQFERRRHEFRSDLLNSIPLEDRPYLVMRVLRDLIGDGPAPEVFAWNQAMVWEMYERLTENIALNVEFQEDEGTKKEHLYSRALALDALKEISHGDEDFDDEAVKPPSLKSTLMEPWEYVTEELFQTVMQDSDFKMYEDFADANPKNVAKAMDEGGIDMDFFSQAPSPVTEEEKESFQDSRDKLMDEQNAWYRRFMKTGKIA